MASCFDPAHSSLRSSSRRHWPPDVGKSFAADPAAPAEKLSRAAANSRASYRHRATSRAYQSCRASRLGCNSLTVAGETPAATRTLRHGATLLPSEGRCRSSARSGAVPAPFHADRLRAADAFLQHLHKIDHVRSLRCGGRRRRKLLVLRLLLDHLHNGVAICIAIFLRLPFDAHTVDQRLCHLQFLVVQLRLRPVQFFRREYFAGEMHQLKNEEQSVRLHRCQIFAICDDHLRDADLACAAQRFVQKRVGFFPTLLRLEKIGLVKKLRIDLLKINKVGDVDRVRRFDAYFLEIFIAQNNVTSAFVLEPFHNLIGWHFLHVGFGYFFVSNRAEISLAQLPKTKLLLAGGRINGYWYVNQPEANAAFPSRTHNQSPCLVGTVDLR